LKGGGEKINVLRDKIRHEHSDLKGPLAVYDNAETSLAEKKKAAAIVHGHEREKVQGFPST